MKRLIPMCVLLALSQQASALDLYISGGAGYGITGAEYQCKIPLGSRSFDQVCSKDYIDGGVVTAEIGARGGPWSLFINHTSNPSTPEDIGSSMLGVRYELSVHVGP